MWLTWTHGGTQRGGIHCWLHSFGQPHMTVGESAGVGDAWLDFWCLCTRDSTQSAWIWLQVASVVIQTDSVLLPTQFTICFLIELFYVRVPSSQLSVNVAVHSVVCCMSSDACCGYRCQSSYLRCRIRPRSHPSALLFFPLFSSFFQSLSTILPCHILTSSVLLFRTDMLVKSAHYALDWPDITFYIWYKAVTEIEKRG